MYAIIINAIAVLVGSAIGALFKRGISEKYGFTIERHTLEVFGLCPDCRNEARR